MAYIRTVKTASGATAVQIVWPFRGRARKIEHPGSAHDDIGVAALKARQPGGRRLLGGQDQRELGPYAPVDAEPLPITSSRAAHLWGALCSIYDALVSGRVRCPLQPHSPPRGLRDRLKIGIKTIWR